MVVSMVFDIGMPNTRKLKGEAPFLISKLEVRSWFRSFRLNGLVRLGKRWLNVLVHSWAPQPTLPQVPAFRADTKRFFGSGRGNVRRASCSHWICAGLP